MITRKIEFVTNGLIIFRHQNLSPTSITNMDVLIFVQDKFYFRWWKTIEIVIWWLIHILIVLFFQPAKIKVILFGLFTENHLDERLNLLYINSPLKFQCWKDINHVVLELTQFILTSNDIKWPPMATSSGFVEFDLWLTPDSSKNEAG